jgi:hypothetical protein
MMGENMDLTESRMQKIGTIAAYLYLVAMLVIAISLLLLSNTFEHLGHVLIRP